MDHARLIKIIIIDNNSKVQNKPMRRCSNETANQLLSDRSMGSSMLNLYQSAGTDDRDSDR